jgi:enoyl-CoA hydratase/carnithine racemase
MPTLDRDDDVLVLDIGDTENRFHPDWLTSVDKALDEVRDANGPRALVLAATGKFFSNGLDLDWVMANPNALGEYVRSVHELFARMLELPCVTVAAIQGHAFAAGAMLTLACDFRVMREDRGFWCLPEVDIKIPFTLGMNALIRARLTPQTAHRAMTTGHRFDSASALAAGIVDQAVAEQEVRGAAMALAHAQVSKAGDTLGTIKQRLYAEVLETLRGAEHAL